MPEYIEYRLPDGEIIGGSMAIELVESMAGMKLSAPRSRQSYRNASAKRSLQMYGVDLDPTTDESFIQSMIESEILIRIL